MEETPDSPLRAHSFQPNSSRLQAYDLAASLVSAPSDGFTLFQTGVTAFKCVVGPAALYNPHVFSEGGYAFGSFAFLTTYLLWAVGIYGILVINVGLGCGKSYDDLAEMAMGSVGKHVLGVAVVLQSSGVVLSYFIFVASSVRGAGVDVDAWIIILVMAILEVPLCILMRLEKLRPTIMLAVAAAALSLAWIVAYMVAEVTEHGLADKTEAFQPTWNLAVGSAVFCFEGSAVLALPVHNTVKPELQARAPKVFVGTVAGIVAFYICSGSLGYLLYGPDVQTIIFNSFPQVWTTQAVRVAFGLVTFLTLPIALFPVSTTVHAATLGSDAKLPLACALRIAEVFFLALVSYSLRDALDHLTALIGALFGIPLSFMFPALIHWHLAEQTRLSRSRNGFLIVFGFVAMIFSAYTTISTWSDSKS